MDSMQRVTFSYPELPHLNLDGVAVPHWGMTLSILDHWRLRGCEAAAGQIDNFEHGPIILLWSRRGKNFHREARNHSNLSQGAFYKIESTWDIAFTSEATTCKHSYIFSSSIIVNSDQIKVTI